MPSQQFASNYTESIFQLYSGGLLFTLVLYNMYKSDILMLGDAIITRAGAGCTGAGDGSGGVGCLWANVS